MLHRATYMIWESRGSIAMRSSTYSALKPNCALNVQVRPPSSERNNAPELVPRNTRSGFCAEIARLRASPPSGPKGIHCARHRLLDDMRKMLINRERRLFRRDLVLTTVVYQYE